MTDEWFVSTFRVSRDLFSWIAEQIHADLVKDARGTQSVHTHPCLCHWLLIIITATTFFIRSRGAFVC